MEKIRYKIIIIRIFNVFLFTALWVTGCKSDKPVLSGEPLTIVKQGSFAVGGTVITAPGNFNVASALKPEGQTFHGDHAYVFYQIPEGSREYPLVFLHGAGQSKRTWESTPDGREGF